MSPIIEIKGLSASYGSRTVLHDVDLQVFPRDFLGIIGPNGGGKTTLIKCILGLLRPTAGTICLRTTRIPSPQTVHSLGTSAPTTTPAEPTASVSSPLKSTPSSPTLPSGPSHGHTSTHSLLGAPGGSMANQPDIPTAPASSITMGYLPQYTTIDRKFPITVEEVILSGLSCQKPLSSRFSPIHREKAKAMVARMGLEGLDKRPIGALSGGQLQRALLGRAVISDPEVLILDEPSTYIDQRFEARLYQLLAEINRDCAIILVSHDIGTTLQQVKSVACVNETLDYHPSTECVTGEWLERHFNCPIELLGHGALPHRILGHHHRH